MRALLIVAWLLAAIAPASAQFSMMVQGPASSGVTFTGIGDLDANIQDCFGLVLCKASLAPVAAADICASNVTCTAGVNACIGVKVLSTGKLDISSGTYCGVGGTQTVSTWCGANCTAGNTTYHVTKLYEQYGTGAVCGVGAQGISHDPVFVLSAVNSQPAMQFVNATVNFLTCTGITTIPTTNGQGAGMTFLLSDGTIYPVAWSAQNAGIYDGFIGNASLTVWNAYAAQASGSRSCTINSGGWNNVIVSYNSLQVGYCFYNGSNGGSGTFPGTAAATGTTFNLGASDAYGTGFAGYISKVWIDNAGSLTSGAGNSATSLTNLPAP